MGIARYISSAKTAHYAKRANAKSKSRIFAQSLGEILYLDSREIYADFKDLIMILCESKNDFI